MCKAWHTAWSATAEQRRGLRLSPFQPPDDFDIGSVYGLAAMPGGERLLAFVYDHRGVDADAPYDAHWKHLLLDDKLRPLHVVKGLEGMSAVLPTEFGLFAWNALGQVVRYELRDDGSVTQLAEYHIAGKEIEAVVLAPGGSLFIATGIIEREFSPIRSTDTCTLDVLDPVTLDYQRQVGADQIFNITSSCLAVSCDELFVLDFVHEDHETETPGYACVKVFSLAGQYRREMRGCWYDGIHTESAIEHVNGRLYISCYDRQCIHVLNLQGALLQVYDVPHVRDIGCMCVLGKRLLVGTSRPADWSKMEGKDVCLLEGL